LHPEGVQGMKESNNKYTYKSMMKNINGIDSRAPSGRVFITFYFPGVKTPGFIILPFQSLYLRGDIISPKA
jgi:hypothetical protein